MSQRAAYTHGSPSLPSGRVLASLPIDDPDPPDSPTKAPSLKRRPSSSLQASKALTSSKPLDSLGWLRSVFGTNGRTVPAKGAAKKVDDKPARTKAVPPTGRNGRLSSMLGRRRRWQRLLGVLLFLGVLYALIRPQLRRASPSLKPMSGKTGRKTRPLHKRTSTPSRAAVPASVVLQSRSEHEVRNGLLEVDLASTVHPIYQLIRDAREEWDEKVASQSRTLLEAVTEYKRRNEGRQPPKGFDKWWEYVVEHDVPLPDEYDQINRELQPFRALSPRQLATRIEAASKHPDTYTIRVKNGSIRTSVTFNSAEQEIEGARERVDGQVDLLKGVAKDIPDFTAVYTVHDTSERTISWDHRRELDDHIEDGEYLDDGEEEIDLSFRGWSTACPPNSPIRAPMSGFADPPSSHSFISSHQQAMDLCQHPDSVELHGLLAGKNPHHGPLIPLFCLSKTNLHSDILGVPTEQWSANVPQVPWAEKRNNRLLWRGSNTGQHFSAATSWRNSHRIRLVRLTQESEGSIELLPPPKRASGKASTSTLAEGIWNVSYQEGNDQYMDIHFTGSAIQCDKDDGTCDEINRAFNFVGLMLHDDALHYKYVLDVDGNAWSARFQRLLSSGSLIFKSTISPEWWTERIQPWVHYVPVKIDYSDLYDALVFFQGDLDGAGGEPNLARQIASEGKEWVDTHWRKVDMTAYAFRLYLEWARLLAGRVAGVDFVYDERMERSRATRSM